MNKKIKPNRYKPESKPPKARQTDSSYGIDFCLKTIFIVAFVSILSLASIFAYDLITQSNLLNIKHIEISGTHRVLKEDIIRLTQLTNKENIFKINLFSIEKLITSHPWIQSASVKRNLSATLFISVIEQEPLAIVKIENLADILINKQGQPFKEYDPSKDGIDNLPVITGLDLTNNNNHYMFNGPLFNSILDFLNIKDLDHVERIIGNQNTGIIIESNDIYNREPSIENKSIQIKLGFGNFKAKLEKAKRISEYIDKNFPERTICSMDLFNIEKVFIKTKLNDALHNNLEKGV